MVTFNCKLSVDTCHNLRTYTVAQKSQLHVLQLTNYQQAQGVGLEGEALSCRFLFSPHMHLYHISINACVGTLITMPNSGTRVYKLLHHHKCASVQHTFALTPLQKWETNLEPKEGSYNLYAHDHLVDKKGQ